MRMSVVGRLIWGGGWSFPEKLEMLEAEQGPTERQPKNHLLQVQLEMGIQGKDKLSQGRWTAGTEQRNRDWALPGGGVASNIHQQRLQSEVIKMFPAKSSPKGLFCFTVSKSQIKKKIQMHTLALHITRRLPI